NMVQRLLEGGHQIVAYARGEDSIRQAEARGAVGARSLEELVGKLSPQRVVWLVIPSGKPVDESIRTLSGLLSEGDLVVDDGNSRFSDSERHAGELSKRGIGFLDSGTSGGVWGLKNGYCLMVGGEERDFKVVEPALKTLAPPDGYARMGKAGAGHYVKMVHNAIEYSMLQGYGEGFEMLRASDYDLDLGRIGRLSTHASVVLSSVLGLLVLAPHA